MFNNILRLTVLLSVLAVASRAEATARGKAIIQRYHASYVSGTNTTSYFLYISNITDATAAVTLSFYESGSGSLLLDGDDNAAAGVLRATNTTSWDESPSGASVTFELAAKKTAWVEIAPSSGAKIGF